MDLDRQRGRERRKKRKRFEFLLGGCCFSVVAFLVKWSGANLESGSFESQRQESIRSKKKWEKNVDPKLGGGRGAATLRRKSFDRLTFGRKTHGQKTFC